MFIPNIPEMQIGKFVEILHPIMVPEGMFTIGHIFYIRSKEINNTYLLHDRHGHKALVKDFMQGTDFKYVTEKQYLNCE